MGNAKRNVTLDECAEHHQKLFMELSGIREGISVLNKRLFVDNGTLSVQTRLDRHETVVRSLLWVVSVLATLGLGGLVAGGFAIVKHLF